MTPKGFLLTVILMMAAAGAMASSHLQAPVPLERRIFVHPDLDIGARNVPLSAAVPVLPNSAAWADFRQRMRGQVLAVLDARSGAPVDITLSLPIIPGTGSGNALTLAALSAQLGRPVSEVTPDVVVELIHDFIKQNVEVLSIDLDQLGPGGAGHVLDYLWSVGFPQQVGGVPVRGARLVATINHGNLVSIGTEHWGNARVDTQPGITSQRAVEVAIDYLGGRTSGGQVTEEPRLELVPTNQPKRPPLKTAPGEPTLGYGHRLVWTIDLSRDTDDGAWQMHIDAQSGQVLSFRDVQARARRRVSGGVFPATSTLNGPCPGNHCGIEQPGYPMPWADTNQPSPNEFTDSAGVVDANGTITTHLNGRYFTIIDDCGALGDSSASGHLDLGSTADNQRCARPAGSSTTHAARAAFYELNKMSEIARGWLPSSQPVDQWIRSQRSARVNILPPMAKPESRACGAYYDLATTNPLNLSFFTEHLPSDVVCREPGQNASILDHEWGHGLDDFDGTPLGGGLEAFADIVAAYRQQQSCIGYGMRVDRHKFDPNGVCGETFDGFNSVESAEASPQLYCTTECPGGRDLDWLKHAWRDPNAGGGLEANTLEPATPRNFVCGSCSDGASLEVLYCGNTPVRQAAWDFVARDLQTPVDPNDPSYDSRTAFIVASRLLYQGSGGDPNTGINNWYTVPSLVDCADPGWSSNGCGATHGYKRWLFTDDDDGNIWNGTPHMKALYDAFDRHGIACTTAQGGPTPTNSGCGAGPSVAPTVTISRDCGQVNLSWSAVGGASKYWVFRAEGAGDCSIGMARIAQPTSTSYADTEVADGREYCYTVVAGGGEEACFGRASTCACTTPNSPVIKTTAPNGGEQYVPGQVRTLTWAISNRCGVSNVDLKLSRNGVNGTYNTIASGVPNTGSYAWTVTGPTTSGFAAFLKVTGTDPFAQASGDASDAGFKIKCGVCTVSFCLGEGIRCTHDGTCGQNGCCNYACGSDPSCGEQEPCPPNACIDCD